MYILRRISFVTCCFLAIFCLGDAYETYDLESMCGSGSLNILLTSSGIPSSGILKATNKISYSLQMTCNVLLSAPPHHYVMISLRETGFRTKSLGICKDYLEVNGITTCERIYREDEERHFQSTDNNMKILYFTSRDGLDNKTMSEYPGFTLIFTAFRKASDKDKPCVDSGNSSETFMCNNDFCIWSGLTCDGHNNCGDLSDEDPYGNSRCGRSGRGSTVLIVLGVLILFVLIIMCVATLLCTKNEAVRRFSTRLRSRTVSFMPKIR